MTILEVTAVPFTYKHSGGGERYPTELIKELSKIERVTGCYSSDEGVRILDNDFLVPSKFVNAEPFITNSNPLPTLRSFLEIRNFIQSNIHEIEFVHIHNLRTAMSTTWLFLIRLLKNSKFKVILTDHNAQFFPFPQLSISAVDYYAPVSRYSNQILQSYSSKPFRVIPAPVRMDFNKGTHLKKFEERDIDLLFVGRIVPWKAPDKLIEVVHYLYSNGIPNIRAVIAGRPLSREYYDYLVSMVKHYNLKNNITFLLSPDDNTVSNLYSASKYHVLMSSSIDVYGHKHSSPELSPATIAEAALFGTPSIVSSEPGLSEQVENRSTGYVINESDLLSASGIVKNALESPDLWKDLSDRAYDKVKNERNISKIVSDFKNYLDDIRSGVI